MDCGSRSNYLRTAHSPRPARRTVEIRNRSKTGSLVPPLAGITATLSHQINGMRLWLRVRLDGDLASFAQVEVG